MAVIRLQQVYVFTAGEGVKLNSWTTLRSLPKTEGVAKVLSGRTASDLHRYRLARGRKVGDHIDPVMTTGMAAVHSIWKFTSNNSGHQREEM